LHRHFNDREALIDIHLYGRRLYENMAAYWPTADQNPLAPKYEIEYARICKKMPKIVFSKSLDEVGWNSRLIRGNIAGEVNKLKEQPGAKDQRYECRNERGNIEFVDDFRTDLIG